MKKQSILTIILCLFVLNVDIIAQSKTSMWKLGAQTYTFNHFTFRETLDKLQTLGLNYAEVYFGQKLGTGFGDKVMDYKLDSETQKQILNLAKTKNVKIVACGVVVLDTEKEWVQLFDFAKNMGIEIITCEPPREQLSLVDKLANQYKIDVAIHNHPKPSTYWNPDSFLIYTKNLSKRIGACADVGHWKRMGIDPVEALTKCEGKIKILHFKDVMAPARGEEEQHDVIWGTGICNVEGMMKELKRQRFSGYFSIEYEHNWDNSVPDILECIKYFRQIENTKL